MATSVLGAARAALKSDISAQLSSDSVTGVKVRAHPPTANDWDRTDIVYLSDAEDIRQDHLAYGGSREETINLTGSVWAFKSGGTEDEATEAETRALAIFASVENALRNDSTISASVFHAQVVEYAVRPAPDDQGYICQVEFTLEITAHI